MTNIYHRIKKNPQNNKQMSVEMSAAALSCRVPLASTAALKDTRTHAKEVHEVVIVYKR